MRTVLAFLTIVGLIITGCDRSESEINHRSPVESNREALVRACAQVPANTTEDCTAEVKGD